MKSSVPANIVQFLIYSKRKKRFSKLMNESKIMYSYQIIAAIKLKYIIYTPIPDIHQLKTRF